jgi:uncharacterized cupredoxin-like copper-binding protein
MQSRSKPLAPLVALLCGVTVTFAADDSIGAGVQKDAKVVTFTAHDHGFTGPDRIPAGVTTVEVVNRGHDLHHAQIVKLAPGKTTADFVSAVKADPSRFPAWILFAGGPNAVVPGDRSRSTVSLDPGQYLLLCLIPDKKGVPHIALGMTKSLTVTPATAASPTEPVADLTITQLDFLFQVSTPVTAGAHTIQVVNAGGQPHEVVLVKLEPGATAKDFIAAFEPGAAGPPPGRPVGGIVGLDQGRRGFFNADFEPGRYALICFFDDSASRAPHFAKGMVTEFLVE